MPSLPRAWSSRPSPSCRWLAGARPPLWDVVLALAFGTAAAAFVLGGISAHPGNSSGEPVSLWQLLRGGWGSGGQPATGVALFTNLMITTPLAWRRRLPLVAVGVQFLGVVLASDQLNPVVFLAVLIGAYSLAVSRYHPALSIGVLLTAATTTAVSLQLAGTTQGLLAPFLILVPVGLAGVTIRAARTRAEDSLRRAEQLRRDQDAATRAAVVQERARIARELHDVVSHHVSVMVIQAGAAGQVLDLEPDSAREALGAIEANGRQAMTELRSLLGLLCAPGTETEPDEGEALSPQPGLDQVGALVERVRSAGQPVTLLRGLPAAPAVAVDLPRGVDIAAYRVVQEALTNALRHAPGARTEVIVEFRDGGLVIQVTNDGVTGGPGATGRGTRSGLVGLAERLRLYGGTLEAGHRVSGGFRVRARVPLEDP